VYSNLLHTPEGQRNGSWIQELTCKKNDIHQEVMTSDLYFMAGNHADSMSRPCVVAWHDVSCHKIYCYQITQTQGLCT